MSGAQGTKPASSPPPSCSPRPLPVTPGSLLQHLCCSSWKPPRLSWLSCSLRQISFSKAFHGMWITASGPHQLDILFLFSESLLLPLFPIIVRVLGTGVTFSLVCNQKCRPKGPF